MKKQENEIKWAILGVGSAASEMAEAFGCVGKKIYAVGNRTYDKAVEFANQYGIHKVYADFQEMFVDDEVDVIYIATPHHTHSEFIMKALEYGKHVLCEKSITLNSKELQRAKALAEETGVVLAEAMTIYHMPLYKKLRAIIEAGKLGQLRMIQVNFGSYKAYDMQNRFYNKALAGGALLDIGVYAIAAARYFMRSKPQQVVSQVQYAPSGVDEKSGILMTNEEGEMAVISLTLNAKQPKRIMLACDEAYIEIMEFPRASEATITYTATGHKEVLHMGTSEQAFQYEIQAMENAICGEMEDMLLTYSVDVMELMTEIRNQWGMYYEDEQNI